MLRLEEQRIRDSDMGRKPELEDGQVLHHSRSSGPWVWNSLIEHKRAVEGNFDVVCLRWGWITRGYGTFVNYVKKRVRRAALM